MTRGHETWKERFERWIDGLLTGQPSRRSRRTLPSLEKGDTKLPEEDSRVILIPGPVGPEGLNHYPHFRGGGRPRRNL